MVFGLNYAITELFLCLCSHMTAIQDQPVIELIMGFVYFIVEQLPLQRNINQAEILRDNILF